MKAMISLRIEQCSGVANDDPDTFNVIATDEHGQELWEQVFDSQEEAERWKLSIEQQT